MEPRFKHDDKALYRQLRELPWAQLWREHVPQFNTASKEERRRQVSLIRAAAVVLAEGANASDLKPFRAWLHSLLKDEEEKIRRYAIAALPKIPRSPSDEE